MLTVERRIIEFQRRQEQALKNGLKNPPENQTDYVKLLPMHMLLHGLQEHMTVFDTEMIDLKFAINTSLQAADTKIEVCLNENAQLRELVGNHARRFEELLPYLGRIKTRFMEVKNQQDRVES